MKTGLLLINLGTPDDTSTSAVRRYLREFLSDPRVIDIGAVGRWFLLNLIILPTRPKKSAEAYRLVWHAEHGSPLLMHSRALAAGVAAQLGAEWHVELAMRYGNPSIESALEKLRAAGVDRIVVLPLFPQYASSSTGSAVEKVFELARTQWNVPWLDIVPPFYDDDGFLDAFAAIGRTTLAEAQPDHVLFSFHGLPERQIRKSDDTGAHCFKDGCCDSITSENRNCYRAQCYATAREIATRIGLGKNDYTVTFQSRLGRTPWIQPFTDVVIPELARAGKRRLAVFSPAFVADCLETLEELAIRAKADFLAAGGEALTLVPSLNGSAPWIDAVVAIARRHGESRSGVRSAALTLASNT